MNKKKIFQRNRFWLGLFFGQVIIFYFMSRWGAAISFVQCFFELKKHSFQWFFSQIPFSVGDVVYTLLGIGLMHYLWCIIFSKDRKSYSLSLFKGLNVFYFVYQIVWGMTYFQPPLIANLDENPPTQEEIKSLAIKYLHLAKQTRKKTLQDEKGVFKIKDWGDIQIEILENQKKLPSFIPTKRVAKIANFKESLYSSVMNYTGVLGYYNPFTTEVQYNENLPHTMLPFTLSHEAAHQLGYAREQEANFIGYLLAENTQNIELKYSVEYYTLKSLLQSLVQEDKDFVADILSQYSEEMKRDRQAERDFFQKHQSLMNDIFAITNDLFLKSNQQEGSVSYSYFVDLLVRYERQRYHNKKTCILFEYKPKNTNDEKIITFSNAQQAY